MLMAILPWCLVSSNLAFQITLLQHKADVIGFNVRVYVYMKLAYTAHQNAYLSIKLANPYSQHKPNSLEKAQPLAAWRSLAENLYALAVTFG